MSFLNNSYYLNKDLIFIFMNKKYGIIVLIVLLFGVLAYFYTQKPHRDIGAEKVEFRLSSDTLLDQFISDEDAASSKFLDKTIVIFGSVTEINKNFLTLDDKIYCKFDVVIPKKNTNSSIAIKGRCIGFDSLLQQIKLDQCLILEP